MTTRARTNNATVFEILLISAILFAHLYVVFSPTNSLVNWFSTDDAFYYFKVAQNISEGHGSTFDQIGYTNGYHPLWLLVCIPIFSLARFDLILPLRITVLVMALLSCASSVILFRMLKMRLSAITAGTIAVFWAFFPDLHSITTTLGMESGINAFFILLFLYLAMRYDQHPKQRSARKLIALGVVALLMVLSRLDNAFLAIFTGIWLLFPARLERRLIFWDFFTAIVGVYAAYLMRLPIASFFPYASSAFVMLMLVLVIRPVCNYFFGLYRVSELKAGQGLFKRQVLAALTGSLVVSALMLAGSALQLISTFPRTALGLEGAFALAALFLSRWWIGRQTSAHSQQPDPSPLSSLSWQRWRTWLRDAFAFFVPLGSGVLIYLALNLVWFGTATPVSGQIKRWWGTLYTVYGRLPRTYTQLFGLDFDPNTSPLYLFKAIPLQIAQRYAEYKMIFDDFEISKITDNIFIVFALILLLVLLTRTRFVGKELGELPFVPLLLGCLVQAANYKLGYYAAMRAWYWIAEFVMITLVFAVLWEALFNARGAKPLRVAISVITIGLILVNFVDLLKTMVPWQVPEENATVYRAGMDLLEEHTEPGSLIGCTGGGVISYFINDRVIVNLDGLISSYPYSKMLRGGRMQQYLNELGLNYVYGANYVLTFSEPYKDVFAGQTEYLMTLAGSDLYRYYPAGYP